MSLHYGEYEHLRKNKDKKTKTIPSFFMKAPCDKITQTESDLHPSTVQPNLGVWLCDRCRTVAFLDRKTAEEHETICVGDSCFLAALHRENASLRSRLEELSRERREAELQETESIDRCASTPPLRQPTGYSDESGGDESNVKGEKKRICLSYDSSSNYSVSPISFHFDV